MIENLRTAFIVLFFNFLPFRPSGGGHSCLLATVICDGFLLCSSIEMQRHDDFRNEHLVESETFRKLFPESWIPDRYLSENYNFQFAWFPESQAEFYDRRGERRGTQVTSEVLSLFSPLRYVGVFPSFFPSDVIHCKKLQQHPQIYLRLTTLKHFGHSAVYLLKPKKIVTELSWLRAVSSFEWILLENIIWLIVARPRNVIIIEKINLLSL